MTWSPERPDRLEAPIGGAEESTVLDEFLGGVRAGVSGALVVLGEAGVGKTTLVKGLSGRFVDVRFVVVMGTESEQPLAYAGIQQLLSPFLDQVDSLPVPQRAALRVAL